MLRLKNATKAEKAYSFLLQEIVTEKIKVGERLVSERDLAVQLGISRITLREALRALCNAGFLETRRGGGTYVISAKDKMTSYVTQVAQATNIFEVLQVRAIIEPEAARLAAKKATQADLDYIKKCKENREKIIEEQLTSDVDEIDSLHDADTDFHRSLVLASHNTILLGFFDSIKGYYAEHQQHASTKIDMFLHSTKFHNKIYEAVLNRHPEEAAKTMKSHISHIEKTISAFYQQHITKS